MVLAAIGVCKCHRQMLVFGLAESVSRIEAVLTANPYQRHLADLC